MPPLRSTHHARGPPHARSVSKTVLRLKTSGGGGEYGEGVNQDMGGGDITPIGLFTTKPLAMAAMHVAFEAFKTSMTESQDPPFKPVSGSMREEDPWAMLALGGETDLSPVRSIRMGRGYEYAGYASSEYGPFDDIFATFAINRVRLNRTVDKPSQVEEEIQDENLMNEMDNPYW